MWLASRWYPAVEYQHLSQHEELIMRGVREVEEGGMEMKRGGEVKSGIIC